MRAALRGKRAALAACTLGAMLLAGCGRDPHRPVVIASVSDVSTLDPHLLDANHPTGSVIWSLFDSLVRRGADGADLPRLASSWERTDDLTWRFHLRHGVRFQDGSPFTAADVKYSVDRMGISPFNSETQLWPQTTLREVRIVDDYTVDLVTAKPSVTMLYWLEEAFIVPQAYYSAHDAAWVNLHPLGSGPYRLVEWIPGDHVTLVANADYFAGAPPIRDVIFKVVPDVSSRLNALATGDVDLAVELTADSAERANTAHSHAIESVGLRKIHFGIAQKGRQPALRDARVRQALNYAVDVQTMIRTLMHGSTTALTSVVNPPNADPALQPYAYDPQRARELLAAAGYAQGFDLDIDFSPFWGQDKDVAETVAGYLQAVGIRTHLHQDEWSEFRRKLSDQGFDGIFFAGWAALISPPVELVIFTCGQEDNASGYCDPQYDDLVHRAAAEYDATKRRELVNAAARIVWERAYWIFLWHGPLYAGISDRIEYELRPDDYIEIYRARPRAPAAQGLRP